MPLLRVALRFSSPGAIPLIESRVRAHMGPISETRVPEEKQARRIYIAGQVQGVGYRYFARHAAEQIQVGGYVKNLLDGRVEVYAIGTHSQLDSLAAELRRGPRHAIVEQVALEDAELLPEFAAYFRIELGD
jgi:acylphosphatase